MSLRGRALVAATLIVAATPGAETGQAAATPTRTEAWRADLELLATELPRRHPNPFHDLSERDFRLSLERLAALVPYIELDRFKVELQKVLAGLGESHTALEGWFRMFPSAPIGLVLLDDGLFVGAASEADRALVGGRVVRLGATPVDDALDTLLAIIPADNEFSARSRLGGMARMPALCSILGIGGTRDCLPIEVAHRDGSTHTADFCVDPEVDSERLVRLPDPETVKLPVSRETRDGEIYWSARITRTLYVRYDSCRNDEKKPFAEFAAGLFDEIDEQKIDRFVLDLRRNSGGDSSVARPLIEGLVGHPVLDRPGRLFVLVGAATVSSAFMNAYDLKSRSKALLVGGTMGQRPNHYGEPSILELPGSGLRVQHSTKFHRIIADDDAQAIHPDIVVEVSSGDYFAGRDPELEAALGWTAED